MLATLNIHGMMGIVLDNGVLFRGASEGKIRKQVMKANLVEAVIALPPKLFYNTASPGTIMILSKEKPRARKGKIVFIYTMNDYLEGKAQNFLRHEDIRKIVKAFEEFKDVEQFCRVAKVEEIRENDFNLNVTKYVDVTEPEEQSDLDRAGQALASMKNIGERFETL